MSKKRFEVSFDEKIIVDTYGVNKNTTEYDIHKSCDLINSLYENNEQLRRYVYHCPQICNIILAYLRKCESEDVKAVNDAMGDDKYFDDDIDTLRSWE